MFITAQGGCAWTATSNANWLTITAGSSGAVAFSVAANTLGPRTGILTIGTQSFIVRQAGLATPRVIRVVAASSAPGNIAVPLEIVSQGDENALGFTLTFDPAVLGNPQVALGADAAGGQAAFHQHQPVGARAHRCRVGAPRRAEARSGRAANRHRAIGGARPARRD